MGKIIRASGDSVLSSTKVEDAKVSQIAVHLEYLFSYGVDFKARVISITDDIENGLFHVIDAGLREMEQTSRKGITIVVNSYGGSIYEALAIVGRLKSSPCQITTRGFGAVMSAATLILACGDKRLLSKYTVTMFHQPSIELGFEKLGQHTSAIQQLAAEWRTWSRWMEEFTGKDQDYWFSLGAGIDQYFTPEECLELGVVDELI